MRLDQIWVEKIDLSVHRQLISSDNSYQATTHINLRKRQLISSDISFRYIEFENTYQVLTDANLQSIKSSLKERLSRFDHTLRTINTFTPSERSIT